MNPDYGMLWWLNRQQRIFPHAPPTGFCLRGNLGRQLIWIDPARDMLLVSRWSDDVDCLLAKSRKRSNLVDRDAARLVHRHRGTSSVKHG